MPRAFNTDYLASGMRANAFFARGFGDPADRCERVGVAAQRRISGDLVEEVRRQNEALPASDARQRHLHLLAQSETVVVATGQQVGLFLGPLYSVYKAATAVVIARKLRAETGVRCVPLFWLQTEDHDFAEIASFMTPTRSGSPIRLTLEAAGQERCSVAYRALTPQVVSLIDQLEEALTDLPHAREIANLLRAHYRPGQFVADAFAGVVGTLFAEDGLLVFNPRCRPASRMMVPVIRRALTQASQIDEVLARQSKELTAAGYSEQITLRRGYPLVFFHETDEQGPRMRVPFDESHLEVLERDPMRFSTSALLRPVVQDSLFPTAVYVGGSAEVNYFAQLPPLYELFDLTPPLVAERAHFQLVPTPIRRLLGEGAVASPVADPDAPSLAWLAETERRLDALAARTPAHARNVERTKGSMRHAFGRLVRRYERELHERDRVASERRAKVEAWLRPDGHLQERVYGFPAFAARVGLDAFRRAIVDAVDPFDPAMREIDL